MDETVLMIEESRSTQLINRRALFWSKQLNMISEISFWTNSQWEMFPCTKKRNVFNGMNG